MPTNQLNFHKIEQTDAIYRAFEKINYNFEQLSVNGGGPSGRRGLTGLPGVAGPPGPAGLSGSKGDNGTRGNNWTTGNGAPPSGTQAINGDLYLDLLTSDIYQFNGINWDLRGSLGASSQGGNFFKKGTTSNTVVNLDSAFELLLTTNVEETGTSIGGAYKFKVFGAGVNGSNMRLANQTARETVTGWNDFSGFVVNSYWNPSSPQAERLIIQGLRNLDYSTHKQYASLLFDRITINRPGDNPDTNGPFFLLACPDSIADANDKKTFGIVGGPLRFVSNNTGGTDFNDGAFRWNTDHFEYFYSGVWTSLEPESAVIDPVVSIVFDSLGSGPAAGLATVTLSSQTSVFTSTSFKIKAMNGIGFSDETGGGPIPILGISGPGGGGGVSNSFSNIIVEKDGTTLSTLSSAGEDSFYLNIQNDLDVSVVGNRINISYDATNNSTLTPESMNFLGSRVTYGSNWMQPSLQLLNRVGTQSEIHWGSEYLAFPQDPMRYEFMSGVLASAWRPDINPSKGLLATDNRISLWGWPQSVSDDSHKYQRVVLYTPIKQSKMGTGQLSQTAKLEYDFTSFRASNSPAVTSLVDSPSAVAHSTQYADTVSGRNYVFSFDHRRAPAVLNKVKSASSNDGRVSFYRVSVVAYAYVNTLVGSLKNISANAQQMYTGLGSPVPIHTAVMVYDSTVPWGLRIPSTPGPSPFYEDLYGDGSTYASPVIYSYLNTHTREVSPAQFADGYSQSNDLADYYALNSIGNKDFVSRLNLTTANATNTFNFKNTIQCSHVVKVESTDIVPLRFNEVAEVGFVMEKEYELSHPWGMAKDFELYNDYPNGIPNVGMKIIKAGVNVIYAHVNFELIGSNQL